MGSSSRIRLRRLLVIACWLVVSGSARDAWAGESFVNFESPQVHPLELTPGGGRLLAVNTADDRLEVFDPALAPPAVLVSIPVGLDPVSVRARTATEVWVVNHLSDSVSVIDLPTARVVATLQTADEPADVIFAGSPTRAFVSCARPNLVQVFDPGDLGAAPIDIPLLAEDPRALATDPSGDRVYVAVFESGNDTTVLPTGFRPAGSQPYPPDVLGLPGTPYGGENPPPNAGAAFDPPLNPANPLAPEVSLIVRKDGDGLWRDDTGADWTDWVSGPQAAASGRVPGWDLADHDLAVIDTADHSVDYVRGLMNTNMALATHPVTGRVHVVGTDANNEIRYVPKLQGTFVQVLMATVDGLPGAASTTVADLNPHLTYATPTLPQPQRDLSVGDPRGVAFSADGSTTWITGRGSNNVVVLDELGQRVQATPVEVGEGPTGLVVDDARQQVYVLNHFDGSLSVLDMASRAESARVPFYDPTPDAIRLGRPFLYDTHATSGLGQLACASCHVDARWDALAWDLGDPAGAMLATPTNPLQNFDAANPVLPVTSPAPDFHPMKGPMVTQTLQDIIGHEPFHWRGDQDGLEGFNGAFTALQGDDAQLTSQQMQQMEDFLATIHYPPNPHRPLDNSLPTSLPLPGHLSSGTIAPAGLPMPPGDAVAGMARFRDQPLGACSRCHSLPTGAGTNSRWDGNAYVPVPAGPDGERHQMILSTLQRSTVVPMKVTSLRHVYEKVGFITSESLSLHGFGYLHDGTVDSLQRLVALSLLRDPGIQGNLQAVSDVMAFVLSLTGSELPLVDGTDPVEAPGTPSQDAHAAVGQQETFASTAGGLGQSARLDAFVAQADAGKVALVAKGRQAGEARGYLYLGSGQFQSDRAQERVSRAQLLAGASGGSELTFTVVPLGTGTRIGLDRDEDGAYDRDEWDAGSDPADPADVPGGWQDLASGLAGTNGTPVLSGQGPLLPATTVTLQLTDALASSAAVAVGGFSRADAPLFGGVLVPFPDIMLFGIPIDSAGELIQQRAGSLVGAAIGNLSMTELLGRSRVLEDLSKDATEQLKAEGVRVVDVRINRTELPLKSENTTFEQMREQRRAISREKRAIGQREAREVRARADRQARELLASARADAEVLRGEGDAESARIYAVAYNKDVEFYAFVRSLEAYRKALGDKTTLVVPPDHEFFRYLDLTPTQPGR